MLLKYQTVSVDGDGDGNGGGNGYQSDGTVLYDFLTLGIDFCLNITVLFINNNNHKRFAVIVLTMA